MLGRLLGFVVGLGIAAFGYGLWKPATFAKYVDLSHVPLGPFATYKTVVCGLIIALGLAVALAALQRRSTRKSQLPKVTMLSEPEPARTPAPGDEAFQIASEDGHEDHGHAPAPEVHAH